MRDITGQQFGMLTAIRPTNQRQDGSVIWEFRCECGWTVQKSLRNVMYSQNVGKTISCGCTRRSEDRYKYMVGQTYGKLTIMSMEYCEQLGQMICVCRCECGKIKRSAPYNIIVNRLRSCGHWCREVNPTLPHGLANAHTVYRIAEYNAKRSNIHFGLTFDQFCRLSIDVCEVCGADPSIEWASAIRKGNNGTFKHNKLMYIDRGLGYIVGNVITLCRDHAFKMRGLRRRVKKQTADNQVNSSQ